MTPPPHRHRQRRAGPRAAAPLSATAALLVVAAIAAAAATTAIGVAASPTPTPTTTTTPQQPNAYTVGAQLAPQLEAAAAAAATQAAEEARPLTPQQQQQVEQQQKKLDALWNRLPSTIQRPFSWTDPSNIAAVVLSVLVSLTSSVDRQGGASLYVAIFAVLLRFRMRQAVALTSLTVFLGSLSPAIAAFCDPHLTERGVLALPDLPGALVILPAMYYGISWGVIVNALLPEWLLTLVVVAVLFTSAVELAVATARVVAARRQMVVLWDRLRCELARARGEPPPPPLLTAAERRARRREERAKKKKKASPSCALPAAPSLAPGSSLFAAFRGRSTSSALASVAEGGGGDDGGPPSKAPPGADATANVNGSSSSSNDGAEASPTPSPTTSPAIDRPLTPNERADRDAALSRAKETARRLRHLRRRAAEAEAIALVYPAFHVPTVKGALDSAAKKGVRRRWTAGGEHATDEDDDASAAASFCPEGAAAELLAGEGDGREQDVAAVLARLGPVTGADALRAGAAGGGGRLSDCGVGVGGSDETPPPPTAENPSSSSTQQQPPRLTPKKLWHLQNQFELFLLLKVVVIHLATEAIRHHTAHPCTPRFWLMLGGFAGAVTIFLAIIVISYSRRRLWRGPQWLRGREQVIEERRERARQRQADVEAGSEGAAAAAAAAAKTTDENQPPVGCWQRFSAWRRGHSPFVPLPANQAITRLDACNATDGYRCWTRGRIAALSLLSFPIGIISSSAGMAGGPIQAQLLLLLKLKPHVVAGTSRVLLSAFTLGTAVAFAVSGNLQVSYGLVFGLGNLVLAPLGLLIFKKLRLPTFAVLGLSLMMGAISVVVLTLRRLAPELSLVAAALKGHVILPPDERFTMSRFCHGTY
jgi:uncharacterized membrane protein YfcA